MRNANNEEGTGETRRRGTREATDEGKQLWVTRERAEREMKEYKGKRRRGECK